jgi:hypothetical protein
MEALSRHRLPRAFTGWGLDSRYFRGKESLKLGLNQLVVVLTPTLKSQKTSVKILGLVPILPGPTEATKSYRCYLLCKRSAQITMC